MRRYRRRERIQASAACPGPRPATCSPVAEPEVAAVVSRRHRTGRRMRRAGARRQSMCFSCPLQEVVSGDAKTGMGARHSGAQRAATDRRARRSSLRGRSCTPDGGHGIEPARVQRRALQQTDGREPRAAPGAVSRDRLGGVARTARIKTTATRRTENRRQQRRKRALIGPNKREQAQTRQRAYALAQRAQPRNPCSGRAMRGASHGFEAKTRRQASMNFCSIAP